MPRRKPQIEMYSYGIYSPWDKTARELPKLKKITTHIPIEPDIEFGFVLKIKKGKGQLLNYEIKHPPFCDKEGNPEPPFTGQVVVNSNDWSFFLGDTVWEPYEDKQGTWELIIREGDKEICRKVFLLELPSVQGIKR